jgi:hypothetical protein
MPRFPNIVLVGFSVFQIAVTVPILQFAEIIPPDLKK